MKRTIPVIVKDAEGRFSMNQYGTLKTTEYPDAYVFGSVREACRLVRNTSSVLTYPLQVIYGYGTAHERIATIEKP